MARPKKQTVDYFPHFVTSGKTLYILENSYGNNGYAFWFKLLEILGSTDGHCFRAENPSNWLFLLAKTRLSDDEATSILDTLADLEAIDKELWTDKKMIWVQNLVDNLSEVYRKRRTIAPIKPTIDSFRDENPLSDGVKDAETPQSKVKESKVKDSIVNNNNSDVVVDDNKNIFKVFEHCGFGMVSPFLAEELVELEKEYSFEWTKEAIEIAATNGVKKLKYVESILNTWKTKGKDYKPPKQQYGKKDGNFNNFDQRSYDFESLERKLLGWDKGD